MQLFVAGNVRDPYTELDEDRYPDPDRFDIFRSPKPHISWGNGAHVCLGMHLARLEMRVALNRLFRPPARPAARSPGRRPPHPRTRVPITDVAASSVRDAIVSVSALKES